MRLLAGLAVVQFTLAFGGAAGATEWYSGEVLTTENGKAQRLGTSPSGALYSYDADGSGYVDDVSEIDPWTFPHWRIDCRRDAMNDKRDCKITSGSGGILILYNYGREPLKICIVDRNYSGQVRQLRVDKNPARAADENGCVPGEYAKEMRGGNQIVVRRNEALDGSTKDAVSDLIGLGDAMDLAVFIMDKLDPASFNP